MTNIMSKVITVKKQNTNYLIQRCAFCKQEMLLVAGSIIYGGKWYHENCFHPTHTLVVKLPMERMK